MPWARIRQIDLTKLEKLPDALTLVFYAFMFFALVATLAGAPGIGFLLLIIGAAGHVVRAGLEDFAAQGGAAEPEIQIRRVSKPRAKSKPRTQSKPKAQSRPRPKARPKAEKARPRGGSASTRRSAQG